MNLRCSLKFILSITAWVVVSFFPVNSKAADKTNDNAAIWVDKSTRNGSFEDGTTDPWLIDTWEAVVSDSSKTIFPPSQVEHDKKMAKDGEYFFHAKVPGGKGRKVVKLILRLPMADPESANNLLLSLDLAGAGEHPIKIFSVEFVFTNGKEFVGMGDLSGPPLVIDPNGEWVHWESGPVHPPAAWMGGSLELRLNFIVDNGIEGLTYEAYLDNIRLVQDGGGTPSPNKK